MLVSRYFKKDDEHDFEKASGLKLPDEWWSRPYEYCWALNFALKKDVTLDAGCGQIHPFKYALGKKCKKVFAVDKIDIIKDDSQKVQNIDFIKSDILDLDENMRFDKIFCISVLHQLTNDEIVEILNKFKNLIKNDGQIIITLDHPQLKTYDFIKLVDNAELCFSTSIDFMNKENVITGSYGGLRCYRAVLELCGRDKETKQDFPKEIKSR